MLPQPKAGNHSSSCPEHGVHDAAAASKPGPTTRATRHNLQPLTPPHLLHGTEGSRPLQHAAERQATGALTPHILTTPLPQRPATRPLGAKAALRAQQAPLTLRMPRPHKRLGPVGCLPSTPPSVLHAGSSTGKLLRAQHGAPTASRRVQPSGSAIDVRAALTLARKTRPTLFDNAAHSTRARLVGAARQAALSSCTARTFIMARTPVDLTRHDPAPTALLVVTSRPAVLAFDVHGRTPTCGSRRPLAQAWALTWYFMVWR